MTPILLFRLRNLIPTPFLSIFCKKYEENELLLRNSIDVSICTVLMGLINIIEDSSLYDKTTKTILNSEFYNATKFENGQITCLNYSYSDEAHLPLILLFGIKKERISEMISNEIGIKSETACAVLNFTAMMTLCFLATEKQNTSLLKEELSTQKTQLLKNLPRGLQLLLGYSDFEYESSFEGFSFVKQDRSTSYFLSKLFKISF